ncbi:MAG: hypothetical protein LBN05_08685 [Oscillospiraceae bacterium]|jgi:hypothetical protein|nr:hypothetical protein [Oscillospiraceae bacterium]
MKKLTRSVEERLYWLENDDWYEESDEVTDNAFGVRLTSAAPQAARRSFALWLAHPVEDD